MVPFPIPSSLIQSREASRLTPKGDRPTRIVGCRDICLWSLWWPRLSWDFESPFARRAHDHRQSIQHLLVPFEIVIDKPSCQKPSDGVESHQLPPSVHPHFSFPMDPYHHFRRVVGLQPVLGVVDRLCDAGE